MTVQQKFDLTGRTALVTGGAGLLGNQFCRTLAEAGAAVAVLDLDAAACSRISADLTAAGLRAVPAPCDLRSADSIRSAVTAVIANFGSVDILVNSAALDPKFDAEAMQKGIAPGSFEDFPLDQWNAALQVNLTGMFLMTQACVPSMLSHGGRGSIINICSTYGLNGPDQRLYLKEGKRVAFKPVYYTVTKAGTLGFTRYLAAYYAGTEIRVNALTPGGVFNAHEEYFVQNYSARTILGRMARPDEMNGAILFLASDASSYMTGSNLVVDGGWTAW
ncbi:MAG TPA: SDR family oxidoreductase [Anaerolineales bacterium]|nr:SDR family oxidoreductase [Anaerolineales bacterium]